MKRLRPRHVYCEVYRVSLYFCLGWKSKDFDEYLHKKFNHKRGIQTGAGYTLFSHDDGTVMIWIQNKRDYSTLAHEAAHAANFILGRAGVKPSFKNDEAQTYLVGWIVEKALG